MNFNKVKFSDKDFTVVDDSGSKIALLRHDGKLYAVGAEVADSSIFLPGGGGGGSGLYLLASGARELTGNWDAGNFLIQAFATLTDYVLDSGDSFTIPNGKQMVIAEDFEINGTLTVNGRLGVVH